MKICKMEHQNTNSYARNRPCIHCGACKMVKENGNIQNMSVIERCKAKTRIGKLRIDRIFKAKQGERFYISDDRYISHLTKI